MVSESDREYYHRAIRIVVLGENTKANFVDQILANAGRVTLISGGKADEDGWRSCTCLFSPEGVEEVAKVTIIECSDDLTRYSIQIDHLVASSPIVVVIVSSHNHSPWTSWSDRISELPCSAQVVMLFLGSPPPSPTAQMHYPTSHKIRVLSYDPTDPRSALEALQSIIYPA